MQAFEKNHFNRARITTKSARMNAIRATLPAHFFFAMAILLMLAAATPLAVLVLRQG